MRWYSFKSKPIGFHREKFNGNCNDVIEGKIVSPQWITLQTGQKVNLMKNFLIKNPQITTIVKIIMWKVLSDRPWMNVMTTDVTGGAGPIERLLSVESMEC